MAIMPDPVLLGKRGGRPDILTAINFMLPIQHITSVSQFDLPRIKQLFLRVQEMRGIEKRGACSILDNKIMASLFYEPSTRTRLSFEAAMLRLGGEVMGTESAGHFSSATKGETLEDTVRIIAGYADVIVLRHPEKGTADRAAAVSPVPIVNAGDGDGEHPTQALLDLFTIMEAHPDPRLCHVVFVGDLLKGRTVHSLARLLTLFQTSMSFVAPAPLQLPPDFARSLIEKGCEVTQHEKLQEVIERSDVLYMTRVQKERLVGVEGITMDGSDYALTKELMSLMPATSIIMHPLPRNNELPTVIDTDPRAAYFRQAKNGLYVRMALLEELLNPFPV